MAKERKTAAAIIKHIYVPHFFLQSFTWIFCRETARVEYNNVAVNARCGEATRVLTRIQVCRNYQPLNVQGFCYKKSRIFQLHGV